MLSPLGIGIIIYVALFVSIGIAMCLLVKGSGKRYIVCGKSLPLLLVGTTLAAQSIDGNSTVGNSSLAYNFGFWSGFTIPLGLAACLFVTGTFFARPLNRMNLLTLPDFYFRRYGAVTELTVSLLMGVSFVILVAGNLAGAAWIVSVVFGLKYVVALAIVAATILVYTLAGGFSPL